MLTYLKLTGYPVGLLINFNVVLLKQGVKRLIILTSPRIPKERQDLSPLTPLPLW